MASARGATPLLVIPAKAGISGHEVTAGLDEAPAFAGATRLQRVAL
jgi:hypothetical protein